MVDDIDRQLICAARRRISPELQREFARLPCDAQADVALVLLSCADHLPPVLGREHVASLQDAVEKLLAELPGAVEVVR